MNKHTTLLSVCLLLASAFLFSCKKDKNGCENGNLCFTLNDMDVSVNATRRALPNDRFRLYWEEGADSNYKNVEIDIFGNGIGEYTFKLNSGVVGDAGFQYYIKDNGIETDYQGTAGTFNVTSVDDGVWSGNFSGTVSNGTASFELKDGKFFKVPLE